MPAVHTSRCRVAGGGVGFSPTEAFGIRMMLSSRRLASVQHPSKLIACFHVRTARRVMNDSVSPVAIQVFCARVCPPCLAAFDGLIAMQTPFWIAPSGTDPVSTERRFRQINDMANLGFRFSFQVSPREGFLIQPCSVCSSELHFACRLTNLTSASPQPYNTKRAARRLWQTARIVI